MPLNNTEILTQCVPKACNPINVDVYTSVLSINNKTGHVVLRAVDVNAIPKPPLAKEGQYLKFENGIWVASDVVADTDATFNALTHVVVIWGGVILFEITSNQYIKISRGDTATFTVVIDSGDTLQPVPKKFTGVSLSVIKQSTTIHIT